MGWNKKYEVGKTIAAGGVGGKKSGGRVSWEKNGGQRGGGNKIAALAGIAV